jgi:hypothetical protein
MGDGWALEASLFGDSALAKRLRVVDSDGQEKGDFLPTPAAARHRTSGPASPGTSRQDATAYRQTSREDDRGQAGLS